MKGRSIGVGGRESRRVGGRGERRGWSEEKKENEE